MNCIQVILIGIILISVSLAKYSPPYTEVKTFSLEEQLRISATKIEGHGSTLYFSHATGISKLGKSGKVESVAGGNDLGNQVGTVEEARFRYPNGIAFDSKNNIYVADTFNNVIKKITPSGIVLNLAGDGTVGYKNGQGTVAQFNQPRGVVVDDQGNVFVVDSQNNCIRMITHAGQVSTFAGSTKAGHIDGYVHDALFNSPTDIAWDSKNNILYVADPYNSCIRAIKDNQVTTVAGDGDYGYEDGKASESKLNMPRGIEVDQDGHVYFVDASNHAIRVIADGYVYTLAGGRDGEVDGDLKAARFSNPSDLSIFDNGDLVVLDRYNRKLRRIVRKQATA